MCDGMADQLKRFDELRSPDDITFGSFHSFKPCCDVSKVADVLSYEGEKTKKGCELFSCLRQRPVLYLGQLVGTDSNTRVSEKMTKAIQLRLTNLHRRWFDSQIVRVEAIDDGLSMRGMLLPRTRTERDVVEIRKREGKITKHKRHNPLEVRRHHAEPEWTTGEHVLFRSPCECSVLLRFLMKREL